MEKYQEEMYRMEHGGKLPSSGKSTAKSVSASSSASSSQSSVSSSSNASTSSSSDDESSIEKMKQELMYGAPSSVAKDQKPEHEAQVTSDTGKMVQRHQDIVHEAENEGKNPRKQAIQRTASAPAHPRPRRNQRNQKHQIPGLNVSPLRKMLRWSVGDHHYVRQTHMEAMTRGSQIIRRRTLSYKSVQVRIPEPLLEALRDHYLHSVTLTIPQVRHFTNQDLLVLSVLPAFSANVQEALVDALGKPDGVLRKLYDAQANQVNSLSNRKLLVSINDKLDTVQDSVQRNRSQQHGFFKRFEQVLFAMFRLLGYLFAGQFNPKPDLANSRRIISSAHSSEQDKVDKYNSALESDYINPALRSAYHVGKEEQKREETIQQTNRQSKNRGKGK